MTLHQHQFKPLLPWLQAQLAWQLGVGWGRAGCPCPTPNKPCLSPHPPERDPGSRQFLPGPNHLSSPGLGHCFQCPSSFVCLESPLSLQGLAEISLPAGSPLSPYLPLLLSSLFFNDKVLKSHQSEFVGLFQDSNSHSVKLMSC